MRPHSPGRVAYWYLVVFLVAFGLLAIASIGLPFLVLGLALAALSPFRARPKLFWPVLCGIAGFLAGFALLVPFTCRSSEQVTIPPQSSVAVTECRSLTGVQYSGQGSYTPPVWPAVLAGLAAGAGGAAAGQRLTRAREPATA